MSWYSRGAEKWEPGFVASHKKHIATIDQQLLRLATHKLQPQPPSTFQPVTSGPTRGKQSHDAQIAEIKIWMENHSFAGIKQRAIIAYPAPWEQYPNGRHNPLVERWIEKEKEKEKEIKVRPNFKEKEFVLRASVAVEKAKEEKQSNNGAWFDELALFTQGEAPDGVRRGESFEEKKTNDQKAAAAWNTPALVENPFAPRQQVFSKPMSPAPVTQTIQVAPAVPAFLKAQVAPGLQIVESKGLDEAPGALMRAEPIGVPLDQIQITQCQGLLDNAKMDEDVNMTSSSAATARPMMHVRRRLPRLDNFKIVRDGDSDSSSSASSPLDVRGIVSSHQPKKPTHSIVREEERETKKPKNLDGFQIIWEEQD